LEQIKGGPEGTSMSNLTLEIHCIVSSNPYNGITYVTSHVFQGFFIADSQIMLLSFE
jgi:hypothetical protein